MHFWGLEDNRKDSTAPHIAFKIQLGGHRQCGLAICTFHLGFSLDHVNQAAEAGVNGRTAVAIAESVDAGATGYLQKYSNRDMVLATVREVASGEFRVQGEAARRLLSGMGRGPAPMPPSDLDRLTPRERQILKMFAQGMSYAEIGEARGNNPMSVRNPVYAIQRKIGVGSRQEMGVWAARSGLLDDDASP